MPIMINYFVLLPTVRLYWRYCYNDNIQPLSNAINHVFPIYTSRFHQTNSISTFTCSSALWPFVLSLFIFKKSFLQTPPTFLIWAPCSFWTRAMLKGMHFESSSANERARRRRHGRSGRGRVNYVTAARGETWFVSARNTRRDRLRGGGERASVDWYLCLSTWPLLHLACSRDRDRLLYGD